MIGRGLLSRFLLRKRSQRSSDGRCCLQRRRSVTGLYATAGIYSSLAGVQAWSARGSSFAGTPPKPSHRKLSKPVYMCVLAVNKIQFTETYWLVTSTGARNYSCYTSWWRRLNATSVCRRNEREDWWPFLGSHARRTGKGSKRSAEAQ